MKKIGSECLTLKISLPFSAKFRMCDESKPGEAAMPPRRTLTDAVVLALPHVVQCIDRGFVSVEKGKITYGLNQKKQYSWADPEEWIRCNTVCDLIINKHYPANRIKLEVLVPRRTPSDHAVPSEMWLESGVA
jgi:hypothetical protein